MRQNGVMLPHRFGNIALGLAQIEEFRHSCHVDALGTGSAVAAVHAVALPADVREGRQRRSVVLFFVRSVFVGQILLHFFDSPRAVHNRSHSRTVQGVAHTLERRDSFSGRRHIAAEQVAAAEGLHDRKAYAQPLARFIQPLPLGIHVDQRLCVAFGGPQQLEVFIAGLQIVAGIDAEHEHVDEAAFDGRQRRLRVMARHADAGDDAGFLQGHGVFHDVAVLNLLPVRQGIDVMNHADLQMICLQPLQLVCKAGLYVLDVAGPLILSVLPNRAQMSLQDKLIPPSLQRPAQCVAKIRMGRVQIDAVGPMGFHNVDKILRPFGMLYHAFTAEADFADGKTRPP